MSKVERQLISLVGILSVFLGAYVMIGWLLANPAMVKIVLSSPVVVFNTAICFVLSGIWLVASPNLSFAQRSSRVHGFMNLVPAAVILIPALVLLEIAFDVDLKIDWLGLHHLVLDRNPHPGRMAPNTCIGFLCIGTAFFADRIKNAHLRKTAIIVLAAAAFIIGASSLLSYMMELDWLYRIAQQNRMAIFTAAGQAMIGLVLIMAGRSKVDHVSADNSGEDVRLTRIAAAILIILSLASGLTGFLVLKRGTDRSLQDELQQKAARNADSISIILEQQFFLADKLLSFPVFAHDLAILPVTPHDTDALAHLKKVGDIMSGMGFSGLQLENLHGLVITSIGHILAQPSLSMPIKISGRDSLLLWDDGLILHTERPIAKDGTPVGKLVTEQRLIAVDKLLQQLRFAGRTTDVGFCDRDGDFFNCFASRFIPHPVHVPMFDNGQPAFPMAHALLGETGILYANDIRGIPVLAAYTPIGDSGLGFVIKIETTEIYGFIRQRLDALLGILALFVAMGAFILRSQIQPLASRLVRSELRMRVANELLGQDAERLNRVIEIQNRIAQSSLDISSSFQTIVEEVRILTGATGAVIELIDGEELFYRATSGSFAQFINFRLKISGSLSGICIQSRAVIRCGDTETDPRVDREATRKLNIRSMIVAPLLNEGVAIGVLKTAADHIDAFDSKDEQALLLLAGLIGAAIVHQQDYAEKQRLLGERTVALQNLEQATDFLRASEERTRVIIESAYDAFIALDRGGCVTDWNKQAEYILGWPYSEALGKSLADLIISPASREAYAKQLALVLAEDYVPEQNQRLELSVTRRSGEFLIVEMTINPIRAGGRIMLAAFLHDVTERTKTQQKMAHLAQYDALTNLPNRSLFMDRLSVSVLRADRNKRAMALMFLDLDGFKKINDQYGHQAGDGLLKHFAERLTMVVRKTDTVARLAGDEFTIILEDLAEPEQAVRLIAAKIIQTMAEPFDIAGEKILMTTSIGIVISTADRKNIDDLLQKADAEMYKAKNKGKNQFSLSDN